MHLGQLASGLPAGVSASALGPRQAWERVIQTALDREVHAVALAGDLVDRGNALFEAYGVLDEGIRRLTDAGISVCAVAGNHDTEVLPRLAAHIEGLHLLGPGGTWSTHEITSSEGPTVRLVGWSFPARHHQQSPLVNPAPGPLPGVPTLGLLHADLDVATSSYAPVSRTELLACGYQGWFLGHIHVPDPVPTDAAPFYLGSLTGMNPREQGLHGPVLVGVAPDGTLHKERLPLAPLRWDELVVDASGLTDPAGNLADFLIGNIERRLTELGPEIEGVDLVGLRMVLTGQVSEAVALQNTVRALDLDQLISARFFVQKITDRTAAAVDLERLAQADHPAGVLARQILLLERPDDPTGARRDLIHRAREAWTAVDHRTSFASLPAEAPVRDEELADRLLQAARHSLARLLAQKGGGHAVDQA
jgi:DNA repair exonuclease SbcCD nuclease subunit